jgi:hypothetical protein
MLPDRMVMMPYRRRRRQGMMCPFRVCQCNAVVSSRRMDGNGVGLDYNGCRGSFSTASCNGCSCDQRKDEECTKNRFFHSAHGEILLCNE